MRLTRSSLIVGVIGVLLLVAAAVMRFAVLPSVSKLPVDLGTGHRYSGSYSGLNPAALAGGSGPTVLLKAPTTASRTYQSSAVQGNTEIVVRTLQTTTGWAAAPPSQVRYAIDRSSFQSVPAPSGTSGVAPSRGLVFTLPLYPSTTTSYRLWDEATAASYPLTYQGTATVQDRSTYKYRSVAQGTVAAPASLGLPTTVTRGQLAGLGPQLAGQLPAPLADQLTTILAALPDTIPLAWTSATDSTVFADSTTGAPIRVQSTQRLSGGITVLGRTVAVPFGTVTLATTSASEQAVARDAANAASQLTLIGTVLPLVLLGVGVVLLVIAVVLVVRAARRPGTAPAEPTGGRTPTPGWVPPQPRGTAESPGSARTGPPEPRSAGS